MTAPRTLAYRALRQVLEAGQHTDEALKEARLAELATRDRAFVRVLLMAVLRDYGRLKKLLLPMLKSPDDLPPEIWAMLILGAAQLLVLKTPPHAAVNETISLATRENLVGFKGLLNAVLRKVDRDGRAAFEKIPVTENFPLWLRIAWKCYPDRANWIDILMQEPPLDVTVPHDIDAWAERLGGKKITPQTLRLNESGEVKKLSGYADGAWWVQDVAAAMPVALLGDVTAKTALDLCAAPGGKTLQLLAGGAHVTAVDSSAQRLMKLKENLMRMKYTAEIQCADVLRYDPEKQFDIVLLDAPCTATGTIRRHPEILIHKAQDDTNRLATLQSQMLERAVAWVKPGGQLLYCVCSLQPEEGERQIEKFLAVQKDFALTTEKRILPDTFLGGADGFYMAQLIRK
jgi:16S rRNA (cytosine967-C5)-methyltransferase